MTTVTARGGGLRPWRVPMGQAKRGRGVGTLPGVHLDIGGAVLGVGGAAAGDQLVVRRSGPSTWVGVVDPSGHDAAARRLGLETVTALLGALGGETPGSALAAAARHLGQTDDQFVTAFVARVDVANLQCAYASAGHPPGVLLAGGREAPLEPTGPLLGPFPGTWTTRRVEFSPGDALLVYSDGVVDAIGRDGERTGVHGLLAAYRTANLSGGSARTAVWRTLRALGAGWSTPPKDDCTLCLARFAGTSRAPSHRQYG